MFNTIGRRLAAGFAVALIILGVVGTMSFSKVGVVNENQKMVVHTYQVLEALGTVMSTLKDAETGQRGYLITGQDAYLEPYTVAKDRVGGTIDAVAALTSDNARQQERIASLRPLVTAKFAEMQDTVDLRRSQGFEAARVVVLQDKGKAVMDQIRTLVAAMDNEERSLLGVRTDASESATRATQMIVIVGMLVGLVVLSAIGFLLTRSITRPVGYVRDALRALAIRDLTAPVNVHSRDEIGQMSDALRQAQQSLREAMRSLSGSSSTLASSAEELTAVSDQVASSATATSERSTSAAATAEQVSRNVQTVAAAAEQMSTSIREIASNSTEAARVAQAATDEATAAQQTVAKLGDSSREIGEVLKVITSIAEQTNLLALNATIEAARAGEMGKGFAVVASEVKDLAQETGRATEDISNRVQAIQGNTDAAVTAIERISGIISDINSYQATIASAVEEQSATTAEITRNVNEAAMGSTGIAQNISSVASESQTTTAGAGETQRAAGDLARMSVELKQLVDGYRY
jgi:methyl-accepting chemotaxis protein